MPNELQKTDKQIRDEIVSKAMAKIRDPKSPTKPPRKDLVIEARDFVVTSALYKNPNRARGFIEALCDEVERQRIALTKLRDSTSDMWACSFAGEVLIGMSVDDALNHAKRYDHDD